MAGAAEQAAATRSPDPDEVIHVASGRFGTFDVPAASVLHFAEGLIGFPSDRRFVVLDHRPGSPFKWLLSLDDAELGFAIADPTELVAGYEPPTALGGRVLGAAARDVAVFVIVTIPSDPTAMTVNLMAPVVVDMRTRRARQVIVEGAKLDARHRVLAAAPAAATTP